MTDYRGPCREFSLNTPWMTDAECLDVDPNLFFPPRGADSPTVTAGAKAVCRRCQVRLECLTHALDNREHYGIWGGMSPRERRALARKRRRLYIPPAVGYTEGVSGKGPHQSKEDP